MDIAGLTLGLCNTVHSVLTSCTYNTEACQVLAERVSSIETFLQSQPPHVFDTPAMVSSLMRLQATLASASEVLQEQSEATAVKRLVLSTHFRDQLLEINRRLNQDQLDLHMPQFQSQSAKLESLVSESNIQQATNTSVLLKEIVALVENQQELGAQLKALRGDLERQASNASLNSSTAEPSSPTELTESSSPPRQLSLMKKSYPWQIHYEDLVFSLASPKRGFRKELGRGGFGSVFEGTYLGQPVAIKVLHDEVGHAVDALITEVDRAHALRHANIVGVHGAVLKRTPEEVAQAQAEAPATSDDAEGGIEIEEGEYCIVMELVPRSLSSRVAEVVRNPDAALTQKERFTISIGMASALLYLHTSDPPIVHRDVKLSNFLLAANGQPKLCDFGLSQTRAATTVMAPAPSSALGDNANSNSWNTPNEDFEAVPATIQCTPQYAAPEVMRGDEKAASRPPVDVFALGLVLYEVWHPSGKLWFQAAEVPSARAASFLASGERPAIPEDAVPPQVAECITACWAPDATRRPEMAAVVASLTAGAKGQTFPASLLSPTPRNEDIDGPQTQTVAQRRVKPDQQEPEEPPTATNKTNEQQLGDPNEPCPFADDDDKSLGKEPTDEKPLVVDPAAALDAFVDAAEHLTTQSSLQSEKRQVWISTAARCAVPAINKATQAAGATVDFLFALSAIVAQQQDAVHFAEASDPNALAEGLTSLEITANRFAVKHAIPAFLGLWAGFAEARLLDAQSNATLMISLLQGILGTDSSEENVTPTAAARFVSAQLANEGFVADAAALGYCRVLLRVAPSVASHQELGDAIVRDNFSALLKGIETDETADVFADAVRALQVKEADCPAIFHDARERFPFIDL